MLNVQKYLKANGVEALEQEFGMIVKKYDDRITINYNQIDSPRFHPIADECRGLILSLPDYEVLSLPFHRFYNYGEGGWGEDKDISSMTTMHKEDGSFFQLYFDGKYWCLGTRKMAHAEGETVTGKTFEKLFIETLKSNFKDFTMFLKGNLTFMFELCTPENRVVKRYEIPKIYLLAVRDKITGEYMPHKELEEIVRFWKSIHRVNIELPKLYHFNNFNEIKKALDELPQLDEGYVLWDEKTGFRVKCKSPAYVAIHHLRNNQDLSPKSISYLVFANEYAEYLSVFPEDQKYFAPYIKAYNEMIDDINDKYKKYKHIEDQKEFALTIKDLPIKSFLFTIRAGLTLKECFDKLSSKAKINYLEMYKER